MREMQNALRDECIVKQRKIARRAQRERARADRSIREAEPEDSLVVEADFGNVRGVYLRYKDSESDSQEYTSHNDRPVFKRVADAEGDGAIYLCHDSKRWVLNWTSYDITASEDEERDETTGMVKNLPKSVITFSVDCPSSKSPMNPRRWGDFSILKKMSASDTSCLPKSLWDDEDDDPSTTGMDSYGRWTDPDFPPTKRTLGGDGTNMHYLYL